MKDSHAPVREVLLRLGGYTKIAKLLGVRAPSLYSWRQIPAHHCPVIERSTQGAWSVETLRPDVTWVRVRDDDWPHPAGRPCVDGSGAPPLGMRVQP